MISYKYKGVIYRSRLALAKDLNIDYDVLKKRLKAGLTLAESIEKPIRKENKNKIVVNDTEYESIVSACNHYNINIGRVRSRLSVGWSIPQAFELEQRPSSRKEEFCDGKVYKIVNIINNKVYIGITTNSVKKRFNQHKILSKYNDTKLQKAMRKLGTENFSVRTIDTAKTRKELSALEEKYIAKFDSVVNGYNTAHKSNVSYKYSQPIIYKGIIKTMDELVKELNISKEMIKYRVNNNLELSTPTLNRIPVEIDNKKFENLMQVSKATGINYRTLCLRYNRGLRGKNLIIDKNLNRHNIQEYL